MEGRHFYSKLWGEWHLSPGPAGGNDLKCTCTLGKPIDDAFFNFQDASSSIVVTDVETMIQSHQTEIGPFKKALQGCQSDGQ